jgi:arginyl-tRNA synthetase
LEINEETFRTNQKNQLYYLQYAYARCCQLLNKAQEKKINLNSKNHTLSWNEAERNILKNLLRFSFVLQTIIEENEPHYLIHYLTDLAQDFQTYYQKGEIIIDESKPLKTRQRILLVQGVKKVLKIGLNLAGITAPKRM